jgi:hypothetical protein
MSHDGFAFSADRDHSVCLEAESDQAGVSLGALLVQGRQGGFDLCRFDLQLLQRLARRCDLAVKPR